MMDLDTRRLDRAKRKAENSLDRVDYSGGGNVAMAVSAMANANELLSGLTEEQRATAMDAFKDGFSNDGVAEREDFSGIGVINAHELPPASLVRVVPSEIAAKLGGNGGGTGGVAETGAEGTDAALGRDQASGWGDGTNANGRAVAAQTDGGDSANGGADVSSDAARAEEAKLKEAGDITKGKGKTTVVPAK